MTFAILKGGGSRLLLHWPNGKSHNLLPFLWFLVYQNTALFSTFLRSFVLRHRRDISTFLDNVMV